MDDSERFAKDPLGDGEMLLPIFDKECEGKMLSVDEVLFLLNGYELKIRKQSEMCVLEIFADGSCNHQQGVGAWAIVSNKFHRTGIVEADNIGYVELYAVYEALSEAQEYCGDVVVYTDSQYVYSNVNWKAKEYESLGWKSKGWRKRIPNKRLLQKIAPLLKPNIRVEKINRKKNRCADKLARKTMRESDMDDGGVV